MNLFKCIFTFCFLVILESSCFSEPVPDLLIEKIKLKSSAKLDAQAKKELSAFAAKIKKMKSPGTVKITGDSSDVSSQDEYVVKSVFMARLAEDFLKKMLQNNYQIVVTAAAKYSGDKIAGQNSIELRLYPFELKADGAGFVSTMTSTEELSKVMHSPVLPQNGQSSSDSATTTLSTPIDNHNSPSSTQENNSDKIDAEDPVLANDLVNKAKARAAQKAKRLELNK